MEGLGLSPLSMSDTRERRVDRASPQLTGEVFGSRDWRALALARLVDVEDISCGSENTAVAPRRHQIILFLQV